jgi:hypothetical protein
MGSTEELRDGWSTSKRAPRHPNRTSVLLFLLPTESGYKSALCQALRPAGAQKLDIGGRCRFYLGEHLVPLREVLGPRRELRLARRDPLVVRPLVQGEAQGLVRALLEPDLQLRLVQPAIGPPNGGALHVEPQAPPEPR